MQPVSLVATAYADDCKPFSAQDRWGYLPVPAESPGTRSQGLLRPVPGLQEFADLGDGKHRCGYDAEGRMFCVVSNALFQVFADGSYDELGYIPGTGRVDAAHNQITNGNEVLFATGASGHVWNTVTETLTTITDSAFPGWITADYIASRFLGIEQKRRYFSASDIANGLSHNGLVRVAGESSPDRMRGLIVNNQEVVLLSERTIEHFGYDPTLAELFANKAITLDYGCAATFSVCKLDNAVFFLGSDGTAYEKRGYDVKRISNHALEQAWSRCDLAKAFAFVWEDRGHKVWYLTFPDGLTWGFDCATRLWHRRASVTKDRRWRLSTLFKSNGVWYGGEYNSGRLFRLDWDYMGEGGDVLPRGITTGVLHNDADRVTLDRLELTVNTGKASVAQAIVISPSVADGRTCDAVSHQYTQSGGATGGTWTLEGTLGDMAINASTGLMTGFWAEYGEIEFDVVYTDPTGAVGRLHERVNVDPIYVAYQLSESGPTATRIMRTGISALNLYDYSITEVAHYDRTSSYAAVGNPGVVIDGYLIARHEFDLDSAAASQTSGLYCLAYNGSTTLQRTDHWRISNHTGHNYYDHVAWDDSTVIVYASDGNDSDDGKLYALNVDNGSFSLLGSLEIDTDTAPRCALVVHGTGSNKRLFVLSTHATEGRRFLKAYSFSGTAFTLKATYGGSMACAYTLGATNNQIISDGTYLYTPLGQILTYNASTESFTLAGSFTVVNDCTGLSVWYDTVNTPNRYIRFLDSNTEAKVWRWNGTATVLTSTVAGVYNRLGRCDTVQDDTAYAAAVRQRNGEYLLPAPDSLSAALTGHGVRTGTALVYAGDLPLDYDSNANAAKCSLVILPSMLTRR